MINAVGLIIILFCLLAMWIQSYEEEKEGE